MSNKRLCFGNIGAPRLRPTGAPNSQTDEATPALAEASGLRLDCCAQANLVTNSQNNSRAQPALALRRTWKPAEAATGKAHSNPGAYSRIIMSATSFPVVCSPTGECARIAALSASDSRSKNFFRTDLDK